MSVPINGLLVPYPGLPAAITDPRTGIDDWRSLADHATRNALPVYYRRPGMAVWTQNTVGTDGVSGAWTLNPPPWTNTDTDWTAFSGGITVLPITVPQGGTGDTSLTAHAILLGEGTAPVGFCAVNAAGGIPVSQGTGADPLFRLVSGDGTLTSAGVLTVTASNGQLLGTMAYQNANSVAITGGTITGMPTPVNASDVVNLAYLNGIVSSFQGRTFVIAATTGSSLNATYNNGSSGVGATLTNAGTQAAFALDGVSLSASDRVLIKDQTAQPQNGLYSVTTVGSGSTNWVLTRTTDYDQPSEVQQGTYTIVAQGTANAGTVWIESNAGPFTIGSTAITWIQLQVAPVTFTLTGDVTGSGAGSVATTVARINGVPLGSTTATAGNLLIGSGTAWVTHALSGDATITSGGVLTIASHAVTYAKLQTEAAHTLLGNPTGSTASPSEITLGTNLSFSGSVLNAAGGGTVSSVGMTVPTSVLAVTPATITGSDTFVITLATQVAGTVWAGPTTGADATPTFRNLVVTDLPTLAADTLLGNPTGSPDTPVAITLGTNLSFSGTVLNATGGGGGGGTFAVARFLTGINGAPVAVANDVADWIPLVGSGTLTGAFINTKTGNGPVGSSLILDIKISTDGGTTWNSLWHATPANRPTIAAGQVVGSAGTLDITTYSNGNLVRLDIIQVGSTTPGTGVLCLLY